MNHDSSAQKLPPEIFELVIDYAHDDKCLLATCALVSRDWLPASRRHLFASVDLHTGNIRSFLDMAHSHCATFLHHIKHFKFRHGGVETDNVQQIWREAASRLALLPFGSVESLYLSQTQWESVYTRPASATFGSIKELELTETYFTPADAFFQFVSQLQLLERLSLCDVGYDSDGGVEFEDCLPPQRIRSLSLQSLDDDIKTHIYRWLSPSPTIVELKIDEIEAEELEYLLPLFKSLSKSLQTLDLSFLDDEEYLRSNAETEFIQLIDLSQLAELRFFRVVVADDVDARMSDWVYECLASIRSSHLQCLTLVVEQSDDEVNNFSRWGYLAELLASSPFARLQDLVFELMGSWADAQGTQFEQHARDRLGKLSEEGVLKFTRVKKSDYEDELVELEDELE